jgi:pyruvate formate lyase activating enzyme
MRIGGIQKCSAIDFPGKIACVLFTQGCNFRCPFCHNEELIKPIRFVSNISKEEIFKFLETRRRLLDAVVISGGEPTLHPDLEIWFRRIKDLGFATKLDTNGTHPGVTQSLIQKHLIDFIAMDIKHRLQEAPYEHIIGIQKILLTVKESIQILMKSSIDYEFRTTLIREVHTREDVFAIAESLQGAKQWTLQEFRSQKTLNPQWQDFHPWPSHEMESLKTALSQKFPKLPIRCLSP